MRVDIILGTAAAIERESDLYDQTKPPWPNDSVCGSPVCLCGWAKYVELGPEAYANFLRSDGGLAEDLAEAFDIPLSDADDLYEGTANGWKEPYRSQFQAAKTNKQRAQVAAAMLRALAKEGE